MTADVRTFPDKDAVIAGAAADAAQVLAEAGNGRIDVALTGGSVGTAVTGALASLLTGFDFSRLHLWFSDERYLPTGHPDRNDTQTFKAVSGSALMHASRWHVCVGSESGLSAEDAAAALGKEVQSEAPNFALSFLGVGPDGHVASLFPGLPGVTVTGSGVIAVHDSPKPPPTRLSFTRDLINSSARVWAVLAGAEKAAAAARALGGAATPSESPSGSVAGSDETRWYLDEAAAADL
ncbi:6-phosphogluconolactonase [Spelaeicoccus albus]|uniref:6-phosphogluconolactonase n=1 Tax=Spelaeicoccus albus TaxID=1280376 RepID=A0A7Z0D446_9MICO|nr:6-phosphogluconolactonase [Spelaeicoccus albus]NYI68532.1 6-phosphogluconolactonase [Spelaeicoccus albus]